MRIAVFCGAHAGNGTRYLDAAREVGATLAGRGVGVVFGGGRVGMMGALADAALAAGGEVTGVIPAALVEREVAHAALTRLHVVESMHDRKALMGSLADGFLALPGGFGTLDEFFEVLSWAQLGMHGKPCVLLDVDGFFGPLLHAVNHAEREGFIRAQDRALLVVADSVDVALRALGAPFVKT